MNTWEFDSYSFSDTLRDTRKAKKLTQTELAEMAGVSKCTITNYENGYKAPYIPTLIKIAATLGITEIKLNTTKKWL